MDKIASRFLAGLIAVAAITSIFGRRNSAAVINATGGAIGNTISASLGKGAGIS